MQSTLTGPWLATVLAIASVLAAYNGLVRRRVAETLGQALMTLAMMAGGMWVILDPAGTVGALGGWANQASLGTLAVTARGTPAGAPERAGGQHGVGVRRGDRSAVVLPGVRRRRLVSQPGAPGSAAARGRAEDRRQRAGSQAASVGGRAGAWRWSTAPSSCATRAATPRSSWRCPPNGPARNSINEHGLAAADALSEQRRHRLSWADRRPGAVSHRRRHVGARRPGCC